MDSSSAPMVGGLTAVSNVPSKPLPKYFNVREASNGFIITCNQRLSYGEDTHIASTKEEAIKIISDYLV